jgi:nucleolar protein 4
MHLLREGEISKDSETYQKLSASEKRQREDGRKEREYKMSNPNFFVSDKRVSFRNLPITLGEKELKEAVRNALGGEAVAGKALGAAGAIVKATIIKDKESDKSKGFGFVEFRTHEQALQAVRKTNNQPEFFGPKNTRSPIVEFTIEDKRKLKILEAARDRHRKGALKARRADQ